MSSLSSSRDCHSTVKSAFSGLPVGPARELRRSVRRKSSIHSCRDPCSPGSRLVKSSPSSGLSRVCRDMRSAGSGTSASSTSDQAKASRVTRPWRAASSVVVALAARAALDAVESPLAAVRADAAVRASPAPTSPDCGWVSCQVRRVRWRETASPMASRSWPGSSANAPGRTWESV